MLSMPAQAESFALEGQVLKNLADSILKPVLLFASVAARC